MRLRSGGGPKPLAAEIRPRSEIFGDLGRVQGYGSGHFFLNFKSFCSQGAAPIPASMSLPDLKERAGTSASRASGEDVERSN